eukprot:790071_1
MISFHSFAPTLLCNTTRVITNARICWADNAGHFKNNFVVYFCCCEILYEYNYFKHVRLGFFCEYHGKSTQQLCNVIEQYHSKAKLVCDNKKKKWKLSTRLIQKELEDPRPLTVIAINFDVWNTKKK